MEINKIKNRLIKTPRTWFITGAAGFIGSNLLEELLNLKQTVIGLDNFSTGHRDNLQEAQDKVGKDLWKNFVFIEGDICNIEDCRKGCADVDFVLHHAALGSVPQSIKDPVAANKSNVDGFVNMIAAANEAGVKRFIYATSSGVYGDCPKLPSVEDLIGKPLSPYALTKYINECYANIFGDLYNMECIGLRYFNVFGPRQDPEGAYAAVIPRWIGELLNGRKPTINGDGKTLRDFCYIDNVIQANILAAMLENKEAVNKVYNIACGAGATLIELYEIIRKSLAQSMPDIAKIEPQYGDFRKGDVRYSQADISKAKKYLRYNPEYDVCRGMDEAAEWYIHNLNQPEAESK